MTIQLSTDTLAAYRLMREHCRVDWPDDQQAGDEQYWGIDGDEGGTRPVVTYERSGYKR